MEIPRAALFTRGRGRFPGNRSAQCYHEQLWFRWRSVVGINLLCSPGFGHAMNRITRYVITEFLMVFAISVTVMTLLMVLIFLIQDGLRENLTLGTIAELIPYTIPTALSFAIPGTCLFATCIVYGRLSATNEIVAIKAQGIPPSRLIFPGLVLSFLLSLCTLYLNDLSVSWGRAGIYNVIVNASAKTIYSVLGATGSFSKDKFNIVVDDIDGDDLIHPVFEVWQNGTRTQIQAEKAQICVDKDDAKLVLRVQKARIQSGDDITFESPSREIRIGLGSVTKREGTGRSPSNLPLRVMASELNRQKVFLANMQRQLAMNVAFDLAGGNMLELTSRKWRQKHQDLETEVYRLFRLQSEPWRRWANGFSCLCFVIVGAPLAIRMRKSDYWTIFGVCFIPILLAYYPLLMFGVGQAKSGSMPPYIVWLGNVVMILVGLYLIRDIEKH